MHFFLEYAVFFVILVAILAIILLFVTTGRRSAHADAVQDAHADVDHAHADHAETLADHSAAQVAPSPAVTAAHADSAAAPAPEAAAPVAETPVAAPEPVTEAPETPAPAPEAPAPVAEAPFAAAPEAATASATDDLLLLKGIGPKLNDRLKVLGVTGYSQIASWSDADVARIDGQLGTFKGRIQRDNWIDQAKLLTAGDKAGFEAKYGALGK